MQLAFLVLTVSLIHRIITDAKERGAIESILFVIYMCIYQQIVTHSLGAIFVPIRIETVFNLGVKSFEC